MSHLTPCPTCTRHVRNTDGSCPFCGSAVEMRPDPVRPAPPQRMGRAALAAVGAAFAFSAACGGGGETAAPAYGGPPDEEYEQPIDETSGDEEEAPIEDEAPPPDEGGGDAQPDETEPDPVAPAYGGPPAE